MKGRERKSPSSTDVAELAGVSQSAVSRTFTGASVSDETRQRVLAAARTLNYRSSELPRLIMGRRSNLIGVVMGEITNPFYPEVLELLLANLESNGFRILLKRLGEGDNADEAIKEVLKHNVQGALITSSMISAEMAAECGRSEVPVVLFNRYLKEGTVCSICCDNVDAGRLVANLLLDAGHLRPAFISGTKDATTNRDRMKGFLDRLSERGILNVPVTGDANKHEVGYRAMRSLIDREVRPDAVFCASDVLALGALDALRLSGLRVPQDVSVVGFDDVPAASWPAYELTTIRQSRRRMVEEAVKVLISRISGNGQPLVRLFPGELVVRSSARLPANVVQNGRKILKPVRAGSA